MTELEYHAIVGALIRGYRKERGLLQSDLAPLVGLARSSIANIETARATTTLSVLYRIAEALGVSLHDLLP